MLVGQLAGRYCHLLLTLFSLHISSDGHTHMYTWIKSKYSDANDVEQIYFPFAMFVYFLLQLLCPSQSRGYSTPVEIEWKEENEKKTFFLIFLFWQLDLLVFFFCFSISFSSIYVASANTTKMKSRTLKILTPAFFLLLSLCEVLPYNNSIIELRNMW